MVARATSSAVISGVRAGDDSEASAGSGFGSVVGDNGTPEGGTMDGEGDCGVAAASGWPLASVADISASFRSRSTIRRNISPMVLRLPADMKNAAIGAIR